MCIFNLLEGLDLGLPKYGPNFLKWNPNLKPNLHHSTIYSWAVKLFLFFFYNIPNWALTFPSKMGQINYLYHLFMRLLVYQYHFTKQRKNRKEQSKK